MLIYEPMPQGGSQTFNSRIPPRKVNQVSYLGSEINVEVTVLRVV